MSVTVKAIGSSWMLVIMAAKVVLAAAATESSKPISLPTLEQFAFFENKIRPVLVERCYECHSAEAKKIKGELLLDSREGWMKGGENGPAIVPGDPEQSLLINAIRSMDEDLQMPPKKRLPAEQIRDFEAWVKMGAPDPREKPQNIAAPKGVDLIEGRKFWSFQPVKQPTPPSVKDKDWPRNSIDKFIMDKLERKGLVPAPRADKRTLLRRACFDLTGLPPTRAQVEKFLGNDSPEAYEKLIDELLASKHYGERWARHWLDVARYADSGGYETDIYFRNAWRYRDYVVKSFNDDKPYDRFVKEQIAGDEFWPDNLALDGTYKLPKEKLEHLEAHIGTGLYALGTQIHESNMDAQKLEHEWLTDCADTTASVFMGLTMGCARCHDHKSDPITQRDYYAFQAVFAGSKEVEIPLVTGMAIADFKQYYPRIVGIDEARKAYRLFEQNTKDRDLSEPEKKEKQQLLDKIAQAVLALPENTAPDASFEGLMETPTATVLGHERLELVADVKILNRGDLKRPKEQVPPDFPAVFRQVAASKDSWSGPFGSRKQLALWLTHPDHPLPSRVMINRIWQWHFGRGIVATPNDFGKIGQLPSHPDLLDWMAREFIAQGWSIKKMHRLIMLSNTYQMTSKFSDASNVRLDPDNHYLWRMNRQRLDAEGLWDTLHATAGTLNLAMGGRPVVPPLTEEELAALRENWHWPVTADPREHNRRGLYILVRRNFRFPMFEVFDAPVNSVSAANRDVTTVAPQALWLLNNKTSHRQAREFAARLVREDSAGWNKTDFGGGQTGWLGKKGGERAGWAKRVENGQVSPDLDVLPGSIITHGPSSVLWQAPADGTNGVLTVSGGLWNIRQLGRSEAWKLWKNDRTLLTEGTVEDSLGTSLKPMGLGSGTGGTTALREIPYVAGDTFRLEILASNYVGVKLTFKATRTNDLATDFTLAANPTPAGWQYSESLENGGEVVGPAMERVEVVFNPDRWVEAAWRIALARAPLPDEKREALKLIETLANSNSETKPLENPPLMLAEMPSKQAVALTELCLAIFNLNEFMYVD